MIVLHAGSGSAILPNEYTDFRELRLDIDPQTEPDLVGSILKIPLDDESVWAVHCSHTLEHLYPHEVPIALAEFYRVVASGGFVRLSVPNLQSIAKQLESGRIEDVVYWCSGGPIAAIDMLYGFRPEVATGNHYMAHHTGFTAPTLEKKLRKAGFVNVETWNDQHYNLFAKGEKL